MNTSNNTPEFDHLASSYDMLLKDPICDRFSQDRAFYHERKLLLIRSFFASQSQPTQNLSWADIGCGRGDLLRRGARYFGRAMGCDVSNEMMKECAGLDVRLQESPGTLPFAESSVDFATAVCVYHHVPPASRAALTAEVCRILKPGGIFAIVEHNPWNPATRIIVSRSPIDVDAILLPAPETALLMQRASMRTLHREFFLYLPEKAYYKVPWLESWGQSLGLGGQYAIFAEKPRNAPLA
jgi:SAM-dependent methyltransferase